MVSPSLASRTATRYFIVWSTWTKRPVLKCNIPQWHFHYHSRSYFTTGVWAELQNEVPLKSLPGAKCSPSKTSLRVTKKRCHGDGQPSRSWLAAEQACSWRGSCAARSLPDSQSSKNGTVDVLLSFWKGSRAASAMGFKIELTSPSKVLWRWVYRSAIGLETKPITRLLIFPRELAETWSFLRH